MLKKHIYLILILLIISSCSSPTLQGDWKVSKNTLIEGIKILDKMNQHYNQEMKEKLASKLSNNTVYSFLDNGILDIKILSGIDTVLHKFSANWKILDSEFLEITIPGGETEKYTFLINENLITLENLSTPSEKLILEKY